MGHINSSAWGTEDPAWGGTRGGEAWGDTAAALIHPASRSSVRCCCRGEQGWRAHRRTLLSTELQGSQGTAGGTCTRCRVASKAVCQKKGDGAAQHNITAQQPQLYWSQGLSTQQQHKAVITWLSRPAQADWSPTWKMLVLPPMP